MIPLKPGLLAQLGRQNASAMQDEAEWIPRAGAATVNPDGEPVTDWSTAPVAWSGPVGFDPRGGKETAQNLAGQRATAVEIIVTDAAMRLGLWAQVIGPQDRIRLTARFGLPMTAPQLFDVIGKPEVGPTGVVLNLKQTEA